MDLHILMILTVNSCNIFRRDRYGQHGCVLLTTKLHLPCVRKYDLEVDAEMIACELI